VARWLIPAALVMLLLAAPAASATPLAGTSWKVKRVEGRVVAPEFRVALSFSKDDRRVGGSDGCNSFGGRYRATATRLRFGQLISTGRACVGPGPPSITAAMRGTRSYRRTGRRLVLLGARGRTLASLALR